MMTLEDFEKSLIREKVSDKKEGQNPDHLKSKKRRKHHHRDHRTDGHETHRRKRSRQSKDADEDELDVGRQSRIYEVNKGPVEDGTERGADEECVENVDNSTVATESFNTSSSSKIGHHLKRDSWMEAPSHSDIDFRQRVAYKSAESGPMASLKAEFEIKIHENELNKHHLQNLAETRETISNVVDGPSRHAIDYIFGDAGAQWRMTKLKAVFRQAEEERRPIKDVALERFDDLRAFDDAREEQIELERRETYGKDYSRKDKPSGELFLERKLDRGVCMKSPESSEHGKSLRNEESRTYETVSSQEANAPIDQTGLNRLKAQMLKTKLRDAKDAPILEAEYGKAMDLFGKAKDSGLVVLGAMENRMLAGGRNSEVISINSKRGRERGLVEENEDMSIEDMVREERRTRNEAGGDGKRFAERIAKDGRFDNGLDYMDENANKLAKRVQKSEINLKNTAISDFQKMNRILDNCPLCHREDENAPPIAPVVSLATRVYLTLPTEPEISDGGVIIVPIQHRGNLLECDDDEWEEIRNFMKCLTRMYHDQGRDVIFYENAAFPQRRKHAGMEAVPLPYSLGETAPAFFREAILSSDEEWAQHRKLIDTLSKAKQGLGKLAFRRTLAKEMPYFHAWFDIDGGLGHIVEDANRWPKGDLFAREIIGGMLDKGPDIIKRQGRWTKGADRRIGDFRKRWNKFDWTKVLTDT